MRSAECKKFRRFKVGRSQPLRNCKKSRQTRADRSKRFYPVLLANRQRPKLIDRTTKPTTAIADKGYARVPIEGKRFGKRSDRHGLMSKQ